MLWLRHLLGILWRFQVESVTLNVKKRSCYSKCGNCKGRKSRKKRQFDILDNRFQRRNEDSKCKSLSLVVYITCGKILHKKDKEAKTMSWNSLTFRDRVRKDPKKCTKSEESEIEVKNKISRVWCHGNQNTGSDS
jgi:hypothetical protein